MYPAIKISGIAGAALVLLIGRFIVALCLSTLVFSKVEEKYKNL